MSGARGRIVHRVLIALWCALLVSIVAWPLLGGIPGPFAAVIAALPLVVPLPGLLRGARRTLRWASLTLAPALVIALTEFLVNAPARVATGTTLALLPAAFVAVIAALRATPAGDG